MGLAQAIPIYTEEEYLAMERESLERHEYIDGRIYEMTSANEGEAIITVNLIAEIGKQLKGSDCTVFSPNMKVRSNTAKGFFTYADLMVTNSKRCFYDAETDVLLNPTVIIEVLSATTEGYDRGEKFRRYRQGIPSFTDYVLVSSIEPSIEHLTLNNDGFWMIAATETDLSANVPIDSIDCVLKMAEVYDKIDFSQ
jgi:Uma2 family endonuclease